MKRSPSSPVATSVRDRLLKLSRSRGEEFNFILIRYGLERLLYRLTLSEHSDAFILKGAMLYAAWSKHPHRATKDLDLLGTGAPDVGRLRAIFEGVCALAYEPDGMVFEGSSVRAVRIKEEEEYEGVRITLDAKLGSAPPLDRGLRRQRTKADPVESVSQSVAGG